MVSKTGITTPIYKIDTDSALGFVGRDTTLSDLPSKLIELYNRDKGVETYKIEGQTTVDGCTFSLFRNITARANSSTWVKFFQGSGINLGQLPNQMQHLVCFALVDDELYAYTAGQSAVAFERFIDISFPVEVGRRIAKPEVKGARSSQITGTALASDVHFRDPRRITYTESLDNVWTALSGQLRDTVLSEAILTEIFGAKTKMRLDVTSAIKLGPKIESLEKMVKLIRWLAMKADSELPEDDGWAGLDAIKILNPRKRKDLIEKLRSSLAEKIFTSNEYDNLAVAHVDASLYDNASEYTVSQDGEAIYQSDVRPALSDIVGAMSASTDTNVEKLSSVTLVSSNQDFGASFNTSGTLLGHLHGEIRYNGKTYFLLAGKWYEVDAVYIEQVTRDFLSILKARDLSRSAVGMKDWDSNDSEGTYNETACSNQLFINGDRVLTDNVELFDGLTVKGSKTYILHVKRKFDVKVRDVRSQVVNSAQIIENDLRSEDHAKLKSHHARLVNWGRTSLSEDEFLDLFMGPRVYVFAYGSPVKVEEASIGRFSSSVARMEVVSLESQFRQIASVGSEAELSIMWIPLV